MIVTEGENDRVRVGRVVDRGRENRARGIDRGHRRAPAGGAQGGELVGHRRRDHPRPVTGARPQHLEPGRDVQGGRFVVQEPGTRLDGHGLVGRADLGAVVRRQVRDVTGRHSGLDEVRIPAGRVEGGFERDLRHQAEGLDCLQLSGGHAKS